MLNLNHTSNLITKTRRKAASFKSRLLALGGNNQGVAAVEFAILAPVMIALYFGLVEISLIIQADKVTSHASNVAGDLATQLINIDEDDIEDVFEATLSTMSIPADQINDVKVELLSYRMDVNGDIEEIGRATLNGGFQGDAYDPTDIGPRLLTPTSGAVVSRVQFDYHSITSKFVSDRTELDETFILQPRASVPIPFSLDGTYRAYTCTAAGTIIVTCS